MNKPDEPQSNKKRASHSAIPPVLHKKTPMKVLDYKLHYLEKVQGLVCLMCNEKDRTVLHHSTILKHLENEHNIKIRSEFKSKLKQ
jgi:hypothetical protein